MTVAAAVSNVLAGVGGDDEGEPELVRVELTKILAIVSGRRLEPLKSGLVRLNLVISRFVFDEQLDSILSSLLLINRLGGSKCFRTITFTVLQFYTYSILHFYSFTVLQFYSITDLHSLHFHNVNFVALFGYNEF